MPPIKAVLKKTPEVGLDSTVIVVDLDIVHMGTNAPVKPNIQLNIDIADMQQKIDEAFGEDPPRVITEAQALEELIQEWLEKEQDRLSPTRGPPDFVILPPGREILP